MSKTGFSKAPLAPFAASRLRARLFSVRPPTPTRSRKARLDSPPSSNPVHHVNHVQNRFSPSPLDLLRGFAASRETPFPDPSLTHSRKAADLRNRPPPSFPPHPPGRGIRYAKVRWCYHQLPSSPPPGVPGKTRTAHRQPALRTHGKPRFGSAAGFSSPWPASRLRGFARDSVSGSHAYALTEGRPPKLTPHFITCFSQLSQNAHLPLPTAHRFTHSRKAKF